MRTPATTALAAILIPLVAACQPATDRSRTPDATPSAGASPAVGREPIFGPAGTEAGAQAPFAAITADETIRLIGTEPFWGGVIRSGEMLYSTPGNQAGETIAVRRFAGNNGLGFSGMRNGAPLDLTVTPGSCSDGMSDRIYPFTATLRLGEEQRNGCAWTGRTPFSGSANP